MRYLWFCIGLSMVACGESAPTGPTKAVFDGQVPTANAPDSGIGQLDEGFIDDVYVPRDIGLDDEQPIWPSAAALTIEQDQCKSNRRVA